METTARRYTTPSAPPPLVTRPASMPTRAPRVNLHPEAPGHARVGLITFAWGRVVPRSSRR